MCLEFALRSVFDTILNLLRIVLLLRLKKRPQLFYLFCAQKAAQEPVTDLAWTVSNMVQSCSNWLLLMPYISAIGIHSYHAVGPLKRLRKVCVCFTPLLPRLEHKHQLFYLKLGCLTKLVMHTLLMLLDLNDVVFLQASPRYM